MMSAHTKGREDIGKAAFTRGPICYCLEEADNGQDMHLLKVDTKRLLGGKKGSVDQGAVSVEKTNELGHEIRRLKVPGLRRPEAKNAALYSDLRNRRRVKLP